MKQIKNRLTHSLTLANICHSCMRLDPGMQTEHEGLQKVNFILRQKEKTLLKQL